MCMCLALYNLTTCRMATTTGRGRSSTWPFKSTATSRYHPSLSLPLVTSNLAFISIILSFQKCHLNENIILHMHSHSPAQSLQTWEHIHTCIQSYCSSGESDILPLELQHIAYSFASFSCLAFPKSFLHKVWKDLMPSTAIGVHWARSKELAVSETRQGTPVPLIRTCKDKRGAFTWY